MSRANPRPRSGDRSKAVIVGVIGLLCFLHSNAAPRGRRTDPHSDIRWKLRCPGAKHARFWPNSGTSADSASVQEIGDIGCLVSPESCLLGEWALAVLRALPQLGTPLTQCAAA